jgi:predicted DNA repair protein MutK
MTGLLALLDDIAGIAKMAATSLDDIIGQAGKAGAKAAGAVIDDAAVTPKYVHGFSPDRELPIVWKIARGSMFNKLVILLPAALFLSAFAPWAIAPLLMLGGAYLCFEGGEKIWHWLWPSHNHAHDTKAKTGTSAQLEEDKIRGAIKTDFILSAEIMTIALAALETDSIWFEAAALALVAIAITAIVYGSVALIVKADDVGLHFALHGQTSARRAFGWVIVRGMPGFMRGLTIIGTAAMLWVGGQIILHALAQMGIAGPEHWVENIAHAMPGGAGAEWAAGAALFGVIGLGLGLLLIPVVTKIISPAIRALISVFQKH